MSIGSESTSSSLLDRVRARDADAWRRLVALYGPLVYGWCRRAGIGPEEAADRGQEVFMAVARGIESFDHKQPGSTFRGWLWTITQNKIRDHFRQTGREPHAVGGTSFQEYLTHVAGGGSGSGPDSSEAPPDEPPSLYGRAIDLIRAEFEERTWQAFWRVTVDGRTPTDVGQELGMSPAAVRKAKSRVLQRLRRELGGISEH